jgi:flagellar hook-basal body protein
MGISSAMNAGVMGLNVNSSKLSTISDNIANSETKGYKRMNMEFSSLVLTERPTSYDAGGVRAATIRDVDDQGALLSTRNNMDLAISGNGFLPVTDVSAIQRGEADLPGKLIRTGSFRPDENGVMRTNSGYALMGYKAIDGEFPLNVARESSADLVPVNISDVALAAEPTTQISLGANLDARLTGQSLTPAPAKFTIPAEYFDILGGAEKINFEFLPSNTDANRWTMSAFNPGQVNPIGVFELAFSSDTDTAAGQLAGYIESVTPAEHFYNYPAATEIIDPGNVDLDRVYSTAVPDTPIVSIDPITLQVATSGTEELWVDGTGTLQVAPADTTGMTRLNSFSITDNNGVVRNYLTTLSALPAHDPTTTFANFGTWDATTGAISLTLPDGRPREVVLGKPGEVGPLSQFKAQSAPSNITKDGSPVSDVIGIEISESGVMDAIFDSGFRKSIYKIPIGAVQNPNGLNAGDGQVYTLSRESGSIYFYDAGAGPTGRLVSNALEESTTDIAEELTQLIKTQRAYSSNAKIIQTVDEMLQETTNLKR